MLILNVEIMIFRTDAQKKDLVASWFRFDRSFFASGACHVLTHEFLKRDGVAGFRPYMILPAAGYRGSHVFASDGSLAFDYHGWSNHTLFLDHYFRKIQRIFPGWQGNLVDIARDFWSDRWFSETCSMKPHQYYTDPTERANAFIDRYTHRKPNRTLEPRTARASILPVKEVVIADERGSS